MWLTNCTRSQDPNSRKIRFIGKPYIREQKSVTCLLVYISFILAYVLCCECRARDTLGVT